MNCKRSRRPISIRIPALEPTAIRDEKFFVGIRWHEVFCRMKLGLPFFIVAFFDDISFLGAGSQLGVGTLVKISREIWRGFSCFPSLLRIHIGHVINSIIDLTKLMRQRLTL